MFVADPLPNCIVGEQPSHLSHLIHHCFFGSPTPTPGEGGLCPVYGAFKPRAPQARLIRLQLCRQPGGISTPNFLHSAWGFDASPCPGSPGLAGTPPDTASPGCHASHAHRRDTLSPLLQVLGLYCPLHSQNKGMEGNGGEVGRENREACVQISSLSLSTMGPGANHILL